MVGAAILVVPALGCEAILGTGDLVQASADGGVRGEAGHASDASSMAASSRATSFDAGTSSSSSTPPVCTKPPSSLPDAFAPPTGIFPAACSDEELALFASCLVAPSDAGQSACANLMNPDAGDDSCAACLGSTVVVPPTTDGIPEWGLRIITGIKQSLDAGAATLDLPLEFNEGACIIGMTANTPAATTGRKCGLDVMALEACEFAVCLPNCPIDISGAAVQDQAASFEACTIDVDDGACASFLTQEMQDCAVLFADASTSVGDECAGLVATDNNLPGSNRTPMATMQSELLLLETVCGPGGVGGS
jgi:hypothetical protein